MKKTRLFVSAFVGMMLVATAAYAWFTYSSSAVATTFTAGTLALKTDGGPIDASGLMPGGDAKISYMAVENVGGAPAHIKGFLSPVSDDYSIAQYLHVTVLMVPNNDTFSFGGNNIGMGLWKGPNLTKVIYDGPLTGLYDGSSTNTLTTLAVGGHTAATGGLPVGMGAVYEIRVSLSGTAPNSVQGKSMTAGFTWAAGQVSTTDGNLAASSF